MSLVFLTCMLLAMAGKVLSVKTDGSSLCDKVSSRIQEKRCNPVLGEVFTQVLAADGQNFTQLCRYGKRRVNERENRKYRVDESYCKAK